MTRINLIDPQNLTDQHLLAEYRELPRIFGDVRNLQLKNLTPRDVNIPREFVLGTGHMTFFYDKLGFLSQRYEKIIQECSKRNISINFSNLDLSDIDDIWKGNYEVTDIGYCISKARILDRIVDKPYWYRYYGECLMQTSLADYYKLR